VAVMLRQQLFLKLCQLGKYRVPFLGSHRLSKDLYFSTKSTSLVDDILNEHPEEVFETEEEHINFLTSQAALPSGFSVGTSTFSFSPRELPTLDASMTLTMLSLHDPRGTSSWAGMFTKNAFPGSPVVIGRELLNTPNSKIRGIIVNNKISNVFPGGSEGSNSGVNNARTVAQAALDSLVAIDGSKVGDDGVNGDAFFLPSSTGVIGWRIPVDEMVAEMPSLVQALSSDSALPAARGIMTTDLYPKVRGINIQCEDGQVGRLVGIAKGAGMIEPNMATMLVFFVTDIDLSDDIDGTSCRQILQETLLKSVNTSFNRISVDTDTSTSDTIIIMSSNKKKIAKKVDGDGGSSNAGGVQLFEQGLSKMCMDLSDDVVRNGEGVSHVMKCTVKNALNESIAVGVGKSVINSPLLKCAVNGNDPNVGRLISSVGKYFSQPNIDDNIVKSFNPSKCTVSIGGIKIFEDGQFTLSLESENIVMKHMADAELYKSNISINTDDNIVRYNTSLRYPKHKKCVEIEIDLGMVCNDSQSIGQSSATVLGSSLSHEYVQENADYRS
jgi:glutamate N-acetyltransferase/amino-acid N-acetyltransferase